MDNVYWFLESTVTPMALWLTSVQQLTTNIYIAQQFESEQEAIQYMNFHNIIHVYASEHMFMELPSIDVDLLMQTYINSIEDFYMY